MSYEQLSFEERVRLEVWREQGLGVRAMARRLERSASTISRELRRHLSEASYRPLLAQWRADYRRWKPRRAGKLSEPRLRDYVEAGLRARWSPQQIAIRLPMDHPEDPTMRVSHETIYAWLYATPRGELRRQLVTELRRPRPRRRSRRQDADRRGQIQGMISIHERPAEALGRRIPGHWEGDLIKGRRNLSAVGVLVERHSRYVHLARMADATALSAYEGFTRSLSNVPATLRKTLTYDRGKEMSRHVDLAEALQVRVYFADPHSPWQRGTCENTNGLLRQYMPKGMDLSTLSQDDLDAIAYSLNTRPRLTLKARTPLEVFTECLQSPTVALDV